MAFKFFSKHKKIIFLIADIVVFFAAAWLSFWIRFDGQIPVKYLPEVWSLIFLTLVLGLPIFYWQKLYHFTWAYVGISELYRILKAVTLLMFLVAAALFIFRDWRLFSGFPRSVILINYFLILLAVSGLRAGKRIFKETIRRPNRAGKRILIVGAESAGEELARSISKTPGHNLIGFIDDSGVKQNTTIHGYPILGKRADIPELAKKFAIEEIIIALPSAAAKIIRETMEICRKANIQKIKILPSINEIIDGKATLTNVREISIEDLLGRETVQIDTEAIEKFLRGQIVLVTGAAGSIGSHLCRQLLQFEPSILIALDQNETGVFHLERELSKIKPATKKYFMVGDICDENKMEWLFENYKPQIIFHAAAYKHVPMMEAYPEEAVRNNIFGTLMLGDLSIKYGVKKFIAISTDKAINPTSVMGATKRVSEMICQFLDQQRKTRFCAVRFGNVLDSQGNVVGIFEEQIKKGGPVEITHPEMKRYFMVTSEACLLVMQAGALGQGGEVFVLDMGQPIKVVDLAKEMIKLAGHEPDVDIPIVFTQIRPGEKLFEEILTKEEEPTKYQKIYIAKLGEIKPGQFQKNLKELKSALDKIDRNGILRLLSNIVANFQSK